MLKADNMNTIFERVMDELARYGHEKHGTYELNNYMFELTNVNNNIVYNSSYIDLGYLCAEELWYARGDEKLEFINKFKAPGFKRTSEDKIYSNSAYGHIIQYRHGFNQLEQVIDILKNDKDSRRAVINLNVPNPHRGTCLDEICTFSLAFYITNGKLECTAMMRSNDALGCMPYDVAYFTNLQKRIANCLGIQTGSYYHFATSLHFYKNSPFNVNFPICDKDAKPITFDFAELNIQKNYVHSEFMKEANVLDKVDASPDRYNEILLNLFKQYKIINEVE